MTQRILTFRSILRPGACAVRSFVIPLLLSTLAGGLAAQSGVPRPTVIVLNLRFDGEHAIVSGEIKIGDSIIAVGGHFLHEGQRVQVSEARVARE